MKQQSLVSLYDFENRDKVFPGIDSRIKFSLLTIGGSLSNCENPEFAFFLLRIDQLKEAERRFTLSLADFELFNPNTRNCPVFRSGYDMKIARKMYSRSGILWREASEHEPEQNPWGVSFLQMFNMTSDSDLFSSRDELENDGWALDGNEYVREGERQMPLYEAKLFHHYDHRFATFEDVSPDEIYDGKARAMTSHEKSDPTAVILPRYWVPDYEIAARLNSSDPNQLMIAEQSRAEQSRAEQSRAEQSRAEQSRALAELRLRTRYSLSVDSRAGQTSGPGSQQ